MANHQTSSSFLKNHIVFLTTFLVAGVLFPLLLIPDYDYDNCRCGCRPSSWLEELVDFSPLMGNHGHSRCYGRNVIVTSIRAQQLHHFERQKFADDSYKLGIDVPRDDYYSYRFLQTMEPVFSLDEVENSNQSRETFMAVVFPQPDKDEYVLANYWGAVSFDKGSGEYDLISCYSSQYRTKFIETKFTLMNQDTQMLQCPQGWTELYRNRNY